MCLPAMCKYVIKGAVYNFLKYIDNKKKSLQKDAVQKYRFSITNVYIYCL